MANRSENQRWFEDYLANEPDSETGYSLEDGWDVKSRETMDELVSGGDVPDARLRDLSPNILKQAWFDTFGNGLHFRSLIPLADALFDRLRPTFDDGITFENIRIGGDHTLEEDLNALEDAIYPLRSTLRSAGAVPESYARFPRPWSARLANGAVIELWMAERSTSGDETRVGNPSKVAISNRTYPFRWLLVAAGRKGAIPQDEFWREMDVLTAPVKAKRAEDQERRDEARERLRVRSSTDPKLTKNAIENAYVNPTPYSIRREGKIWFIELGEAQAIVPNRVGLLHIGRLILDRPSTRTGLDLQQWEVRIRGQGSKKHGAVDELHAGVLSVSDGNPGLALIEPEELRDLLKQIQEKKVEIADAERSYDPLLESYQEELDALEEDLRRRTGRGGQPRIGSSDFSRAHRAVSKAIDEALAEIRKLPEGPKIADHLYESIYRKRGFSYKPAREETWDVEIDARIT